MSDLAPRGSEARNAGPRNLSATEDLRPRTDSSGFARRGFADQLSIDTPEGVALSFPVAGLGSRFVALLLDHLIQFGAVVVVGLIVVLVGVAARDHGSRSLAGHDSLAGKWFLAAAIFTGFLLFWGYFALFEAFWKGQTPGKRAMKLRVIGDSGRQITLFESLARNLLRVADYLPSLYLIGVITMLTNGRNKRLGDLAAGTLVIHERGGGEPLPLGGISPLDTTPARTSQGEAQAGSTGPFPTEALARLSAQDLVIVEAFFARALDLPLDIRAAMAERILRELTSRMAVAPPEGSPERALEAIGVALRQGRRRLR